MKLASIILIVPFTVAATLAQSPAPATTGLHTDLSRARFQQVSFSGAQFQESDLSKAAFRSVNLSGASITSADLSGVQISSSNVGGMKIDGVLVTDLQKAYHNAKKR